MLPLVLRSWAVRGWGGESLDLTQLLVSGLRNSNQGLSGQDEAAAEPVKEAGPDPFDG